MAAQHVFLLSVFKVSLCFMCRFCALKAVLTFFLFFPFFSAFFFFLGLLLGNRDHGLLLLFFYSFDYGIPKLYGRVFFFILCWQYGRGGKRMQV